MALTNSTTFLLEEDQYSLENIQHVTGVEQTDADEKRGLLQYSYSNAADLTDPFIQTCRGLLYHNGKFLGRSLPFNPEFAHTDVENIKAAVGDLSKWRVFDAYEGSLLRLINIDGEWLIVTNRKLDAYRSRWGNADSFGQLFVTALENLARDKLFTTQLGEGKTVWERFTNTLNPAYQYAFLLLKTDQNRLVCKAGSEPVVYHAGTFVDRQLVLDQPCAVQMVQSHQFDDLDQLLKWIDDNVEATWMQGLVLYGEGNYQVKILHRDYMEMARVRGNTPDVMFRYLQVRRDRQQCQMLQNMFPERREDFELYEKTLYNIACHLHNVYYKKYVERDPVARQERLPQDEYIILSKCHQDFINSMAAGRKQITDLKKMINVLDEQNPARLNRLVKSYIMATN